MRRAFGGLLRLMVKPTNCLAPVGVALGLIGIRIFPQVPTCPGRTAWTNNFPMSDLPDLHLGCRFEPYEGDSLGVEEVAGQAILRLAQN